MTETDDYLDSKMLYCAFTTATDQTEEARVSLMKASPPPSSSSSICPAPRVYLKDSTSLQFTGACCK